MRPLLRLLRLARPFWGWFLLAGVAGLLTVVSGVGLLATSAFLIASAALHPPLYTLMIPITAVRFFGISRAFFRYADRYASHDATLRVLTRIRVWFYERLEPLAPARLTRHRTGDLLARSVGDVDVFQDLFARAISPILVAGLVGVGVSLFIAMFDTRLGLAFAAFYVLAGVGVPIAAAAAATRAGRSVVLANASLKTQTVELAQGLPDILSLGAERRALDEMHAASGRLERAQRRSGIVSAAAAATLALLVNLALWAQLLVAIPLVSSGRMGGVYLAVVALAVLASFEAVAGLPEAFRALGAQREAARRLFDIIDQPPAVVDPPPDGGAPGQDVRVAPAGHKLEVRGLSFRYGPDEPWVLKHVDLTLPEGGRVAIMGPSGAGKTTLVHVLLRLWDYETGSVRVGGRELRTMPQEEARRFFSVVSQRTDLFPVTLRENVSLGRPDATQAELDEAAAAAGILDLVRRLPQGWETPVGTGGTGVSGGEARRIAIARALLRDAPIVILDEPTEGLDAVTERDVLRSLDVLTRGRSVLVITHRRAPVEMADRTLWLEEGARMGPAVRETLGIIS